MQQRIRVAIIGAGWAGQTTAKFYRRLPWVDIVGWADIVPGKAAAAAAEFEVPPEAVYLDFRKMLDKVDPDGVSVCSFNNGHREPTIAALERDKYVHLEKPMAATLDDAQAIMRAADRSKGQLLVGFQPFFSSEHKAAREIVKAGTLGEIYYSEAVAHRRWGMPGGNFVKKATAGAGSLVDIGVYAIHAALTLLGDVSPVTVSAFAGSPLAKRYPRVNVGFGGSWTSAEVEVEEFAAGFVRFSNGTVLVIKSAWNSNIDSMGRSFFLGTKGGLALDPLELYINQQIGDLNLTSVPKNIRPIEDWPEKIKVFAEITRDRLPSPIDRRSVFLVNVLMDGMLRSAEANREVTVSAAY